MPARFVLHCASSEILCTLRGNEDTTRIELEFYEAVDGDTAKFNLNNKIITVRFWELIHQKQYILKKKSNHMDKKRVIIPRQG